MAETLNFDNAPAGTPPEGWTLTKTGKGEPKWTVEAEPSAPSKPNVLKQSGRATFPVAIKSGTALRDGFVEVKFKAVAGTEDRAAGIIWRVKDADNYYVVRANALEDNVVLYKTIKGIRTSLEIVGRKGGYGVSTPVTPGQWHVLRCDFAGSRFKVTYDGKSLFEVEDATIPDAGMIGLWTKADSVTLFDDLTYGETKWAFVQLIGDIMNVGCLSIATAALIASTCPMRAEDALVAYKSLTPELALDLATAALGSCRNHGYQVAVAVVDRFGVTQVVLRDRFAGPHTPSTASGKAWTAASFKTSTMELNAVSQPGMMQSGIRSLPGVVIIAGGLILEAGGSLVGAIGVSGAPGGDADEACARDGIAAIRDKLEF